jgi:DMSO/TMAO reductase YedYZ molybdopterin-dependent catalytic subunit
MTDRIADIQRRRLLAGGAGLIAASSLGAFIHPAWAQPKPLPQYVSWKRAENLIIHTPTTIETKRAALAPHLLTPEVDLFIRNNLPPPAESIVANRDAWQVSIEGVKNPRTLTVGELKKMGKTELTAVLQCSGNGRGYFKHKPSGTPWQVGAAGNCTWGGVPLKQVVASLGGVADGARFITGTGGETIPANVEAKRVVVERSVPLKALEDAMLAWELNGNPVSLAHGGPLRLIVPGYTGVNNVKYIRRLAFTAQETDAGIQATRYRITPIGTKAAPNYPSVWEMDVKSWINLPSPDAGPVKAGSVLIEGVAFGGTTGVKRIEVSTDGGQTWRDGHFVGPDLGKYAWRQFVFPVRLQPGQYLIACRATDVNGRVQPEDRPENDDGYNNNSWRDHALSITVA